ncbi:MAG TPA: lysophospholipid acyltransferase family protein [Syntrophorhabdaceae bacterium]|nr:lysophospholipid acyltransferase family protein [Syntrophorhabdaceae bacterium]HQH43855.1 lysophospholipid acyltransferase family protein [Syntrophorhabdaceae bacterium]
MRRILALLNLVFSTIFLSFIAIIIAPFNCSEKINNALARLWARLHLFVCGIKVISEGSENIEVTPCVFMCNHESVLDIFALYCSLDVPFKWIAKKELFSVPFLGWALKAGGHIDMDRKNPRKAVKALNRAAHYLEEGKNIIIFPEGTWGRGDRLLPFKRGGFNLAIKVDVPITPVAIKGTGRLQPEGSYVPKSKGLINVSIGKPIYHSKDISSRARLMEEVRIEIERLLAENNDVELNI